jgi:hypothetical protein
VRTIDSGAIKAHADLRFRSEYDYALFEYFRSAKVFAFLDQSGVRLEGRVLDMGCGGGGMPLSFAEETASVVAIDLIDRFRDAGTRLATEKSLRNLDFLQADAYLAQARRVLKPGGWMYLSTAPYLSFAGAHLPRLKVPVPLHLLLGRRIAFSTFRALSRYAPWTLREQVTQNSFIKLARQGVAKPDDLLELVRVQRLRAQIARAGFAVAREHLHLTGTFRRLPGPIPGWLRESPLTQDVVIGNMEYVLR